MARIIVQRPPVAFPRPTVSGSGTVNGGGGGSVLFTADFSDPSPPGHPPNCYNFETRAGAGSAASYTHMPTGGPGGIPCVEITQNAGFWQYLVGYTTPSFSEPWVLGDTIYYCALVWLAAGTTFFDDTDGGKFIDHGSGFNRNLGWISPPYYVGSGGGTLGWPINNGGRALPAYFGLSGSDWENSPNDDGLWGSFQMSRGTGFKASEPALITASDRSPPQAPSPVGPSAAPTDGWYYVQFMSKSGNVPSLGVPPYSRYSVWVNNNNESTPSADQYFWNPGGEDEPIDPDPSWNNGVVVGSYVGGGSPGGGAFTFRLAGFQVRRNSFNPSWYPG